MAQGGRVKMGVGLVMAAALVLTYGLTQVGKDQAENRLVSIAGMWTPSPRIPDGVQVFITVGGSNKMDKVESVAPFTRQYTAKRGEVVLVRFTLLGNDGAGVLGCGIWVDGHERDSDHKKNPGPHFWLDCQTTVM